MIRPRREPAWQFAADRIADRYRSGLAANVAGLKEVGLETIFHQPDFFLGDHLLLGPIRRLHPDYAGCTRLMETTAELPFDSLQNLPAYLCRGVNLTWRWYNIFPFNLLRPAERRVGCTSNKRSLPVI